jgi:hypothetical protein
MYFGSFRNVYPLKTGTKGKIKVDARGSFPACALDEANNQAEEHKLAKVKALKSSCVRISSSLGSKADIDNVINCKKAISGHTKNTKLAGVTKVGNKAANAALLVGPTVLVRTEDNVASEPGVIGPIPIMDAILIRPKYDKDNRAGA